MTMPDPNSFYSLLMQNEARQSDQGRHFHTTLDSLAQERGLPLERYQQIDNHPHLTDNQVIDIIFDDRNDIQRKLCIGDITRGEFTRRFREGLALYENGGIRLGLVFNFTSFPETYLFPRIAHVLRNSGKLMNPQSAETRITDTAKIMVQAMSGSCLATMTLVAASHLIRNLRGNDNYNEDTVEFTLLTFSYFGAKRSGVREDDWFFYWKVFGSLMGLGPTRLHNDFKEARTRMAELHKQCPSPPNADSKALLDVYIQAYKLSKEKKMRELNDLGVITKRVHAYFESQNIWPRGLARAKDPAE